MDDAYIKDKRSQTLKTLKTPGCSDSVQLTCWNIHVSSDWTMLTNTKCTTLPNAQHLEDAYAYTSGKSNTNIAATM